MRTDGNLPVGYSVVPQDALELVKGGLRLGQPGILTDESGCWHARIRNTSRRRYGSARWLWHAEIDPGAPARYRLMTWRSATGTPVPSGCALGTSCGNPHCISPYHLTISARPLPPSQPPKAGRWAWFEEVNDETGELIESVRRVASEVQPVKDWSRILIRTKPERNGLGEARGERHHKAKLTERDVQAIRAARSDGSSMSALALHYSVSAPTIRDIVLRKTWAHID